MKTAEEVLNEMIAELEFSNKEIKERSDACEDALGKAYYEGIVNANNDAIEIAKLLITKAK